MKTAGLLASQTAAAGGDHVTQVYRYAVRRGALESVEATAADLPIGLPEAGRAVALLVESGLLRPAGGTDGRLLPVDPEVVTARLISSVEREIYQRRELIDQIRERIDVFRQDYAGSGGQPAATDSIEYLTGSMEVRGFLKVACDACREEVLLLQPCKGDAAECEDLSEACLALLDRGVVVRVVSQHRSRADLVLRMRMKRLTDAGAAVRTVSYVPRAAAVFDRSLAVLFGLSDGATSVARVHNPGVVQFLLDLFDHLWDAAVPLVGLESGYASVADDLQQAIAGLMAKGYTDEVVARKLGMSVRTCRRHIAALMRDLDSISRFQAGVHAARRCLVNGA